MINKGLSKMHGLKNRINSIIQWQQPKKPKAIPSFHVLRSHLDLSHLDLQGPDLYKSTISPIPADHYKPDRLSIIGCGSRKGSPVGDIKHVSRGSYYEDAKSPLRVVNDSPTPPSSPAQSLHSSAHTQAAPESRQASRDSTPSPEHMRSGSPTQVDRFRELVRMEETIGLHPPSDGHPYRLIAGTGHVAVPNHDDLLFPTSSRASAPGDVQPGHVESEPRLMQATPYPAFSGQKQRADHGHIASEHSRTQPRPRLTVRSAQELGYVTVKDRFNPLKPDTWFNRKTREMPFENVDPRRHEILTSRSLPNIRPSLIPSADIPLPPPPRFPHPTTTFTASSAAHSHDSDKAPFAPPLAPFMALAREERMVQGIGQDPGPRTGSLADLRRPANPSISSLHTDCQDLQGGRISPDRESFSRTRPDYEDVLNSEMGSSSSSGRSSPDNDPNEIGRAV